jgi:hypothetical protein
VSPRLGRQELSKDLLGRRGILLKVPSVFLVLSSTKGSFPGHIRTDSTNIRSFKRSKQTLSTHKILTRNF